MPDGMVGSTPMLARRVFFFSTFGLTPFWKSIPAGVHATQREAFQKVGWWVVKCDKIDRDGLSISPSADLQSDAHSTAMRNRPR